MSATGASPRSLTRAVDPDGVAFNVTLSNDDGRRTVHVAGELDMATRNLFLFACLAGQHADVVVDMSRLTFMDCGGYGALVGARRALLEHGASLTVRNQTGQPARLLRLFARIEPAA